MATTWTAPMAWTASKAITAARLNQYIGNDGVNPGNLTYLLNRPTTAIKRDNNATYTTTSTTFVDIDTANLAVTITMSGSVALVTFCGIATANNTIYGFFDITVDGTRVGAAGADGIASASGPGNQNMLVGFAVLVTGLSAGSHTFRVQWKYGAGSTAANLGLYAGNNLGGSDAIPCLGAIEVG